MVTLELITTGSELMRGQVLNTHQQWICRQLADRGYRVQRQVAVADTGTDIQAAVAEALGRADWVITTGGLGPTSDDLTRELIAQLLGRPLQADPAVRAHLAEFFARRNRPLPPRTAVQAQVPAGARVLSNAQGTAPGLILEVDPNPFRPGRRAWLVMLPGPPRELRPMFTEQVLPLLEREAPPPEPFAGQTLRTVGIGESQVEQLLAPGLEPLTTAGLEVGYCSRPGEVDVRLEARGPTAGALVTQAEAIARQSLGDHVFGCGDDELDAVVVRLLKARQRTLAVAESCTGGLLANRLTNIPGASAVFRGGLAAYHNDAKEQWLDVRAETLATHGAVSEVVAREMAVGARARFGADYALAITGIAGPEGGTPEKPVGTVWIALAGPARTEAIHRLNPWDRLTFKHVTSQQALELLRGTLLRGD